MAVTKKTNLQIAKRMKNDEFYTLISDIEKELINYKDILKDKVIFCNGNDGLDSNFYLYFKQNFQRFSLKEVIAIEYIKNKNGLKHTITLDENGNLKEETTTLKEDGSFQSNEAIFMMNKADIIITNPPFSKIRNFLSLLFLNRKKFLIIAPFNALTYTNIFPYFKNHFVTIGITFPKQFITNKQTNQLKKFGNICWFTNLKMNQIKPFIPLIETYDAKKYLKYDNYDAINVDNYKLIPKDYHGVMGVPITFMNKINFNQFELIGQMSSTKINDFNKGYPYINHKKKYSRILIKNKMLK